MLQMFKRLERPCAAFAWMTKGQDLVSLRRKRTLSALSAGAPRRPREPLMLPGQLTHGFLPDKPPSRWLISRGQRDRKGCGDPPSFPFRPEQDQSAEKPGPAQSLSLVVALQDQAD